MIVEVLGFNRHLKGEERFPWDASAGADAMAFVSRGLLGGAAQQEDWSLLECPQWGPLIEAFVEAESPWLDELVREINSRLPDPARVFASCRMGPNYRVTLTRGVPGGMKESWEGWALVGNNGVEWINAARRLIDLVDDNYEVIAGL